MTNLEREVLSLLAQGLSTEQIAERLDIGVVGVLHVRKVLCMKARTQRRSGLIKYARANNVA